MRKVLAILMAVCLVLCITACGEDTSTKKAQVGTKDKGQTVEIKDPNAGKFRVGFGRRDIMPEYDVPLAGYGNTMNRISNGYLDELVASCTAVSDEDNNTVLLFSVDLIAYPETLVQTSQNAVSKATGVPVNNIIFNCSHTHSAPETTQTKSGAISIYNNMLRAHFVEIAIKAMNSRVPAKMYFGECETEGNNFVRHYMGDDGTVLGDNHNDTDYKGNIVKHMTDSDKTLFMLKFEREGEKDVYYINFRAHAQMTGGTKKYNISSDWVGVARRYFEEKVDDAWFTYYQGGAGNQNPTSRIASENEKYGKDYKKTGIGFAEYAIGIHDKLKDIGTGKITTKHQQFTAKSNHRDDKLLAFAMIVYDNWNSSYDSAATKRLAKQYNIASQYHAESIIANSKRGVTINPITLNTVAIGDVAFTYVPFEQFDTNSCFVMDNSPYKYTMAHGYSNGRNGYIPSAYGYKYGCYESDTTKFAEGTAEEVANTLVKMLNEMKNSK